MIESRFGGETRPLLLAFSAEWCSYCHDQKPLVQKIETEYADRLDVIRVDIDREPEIARAAGLKVVPALIMVNGCHDQGGLLIGQQNEETIRNMVESVLALEDN
jgi:thioredoxin-like negative regulator of GroEL